MASAVYGTLSMNKMPALKAAGRLFSSSGPEAEIASRQEGHA